MIGNRLHCCRRTLFATLVALVYVVSSTAAASPVIGILSQPKSFNSTRRNNSHHYIAASYVKWVEAGGGRSIPIPYDATPDLLDDMFTQINGLLLPGGASPMPQAVVYLLDKIVESNNQGNYFPVWGTCLGFEFLIAYAGGDEALQSGFDAHNISLPLEHVISKRLYKDPVTFKTVRRRHVTMNNHHQGIEPNQFLSNDKLPLLWKITSVNHDKVGRRFVSTIEPVHPTRFPIYGVQYHPEKNAFEYSTYPNTNIPYEAINHSEQGVAFSIYTARFFVKLARHGQVVNADYHDYDKSSVYPVVTTYPIHAGLKFEQIYIIPHASHWTNGTIRTTRDPQDRLRGKSILADS